MIWIRIKKVYISLSIEKWWKEKSPERESQVPYKHDFPINPLLSSHTTLLSPPTQTSNHPCDGPALLLKPQ